MNFSFGSDCTEKQHLFDKEILNILINIEFVSCICVAAPFYKLIIFTFYIKCKRDFCKIQFKR